jgi:hypothetical protein
MWSEKLSRFKLKLLATVLLIAGQAFAAPQSLTELTPAQVSVHVTELGTKAALIKSKVKRKQAESLASSLGEQLAQIEAWDTVAESQRMQIVNQYEELRSSVNADRSNQMRCRKVKRLGTHIAEAHCKSYGKTETDATDSSNELWEIQAKSQQLEKAN